VIPVLEGCAVPRPGPLFVEQPEIHLHPRAQGELAQILCDASKRRQMIVETHSEHMINRARRLVAEGKMAPDHVVIHYIDRDEDGSHAVTIGVDDAGDFTRDWPDGFYDERYRETMKIAEAQARRSRRRSRKAAG
jgi:predicted ATPase